MTQCVLLLPKVLPDAIRRGFKLCPSLLHTLAPVMLALLLLTPVVYGQQGGGGGGGGAGGGGGGAAAGGAGGTAGGAGGAAGGAGGSGGGATAGAGAAGTGAPPGGAGATAGGAGGTGAGTATGGGAGGIGAATRGGTGASDASGATTSEPSVPFDLAGVATSGSLTTQIVVMLTLLGFIPAILVSMTCFTRLIIVFHFLRQALGTQEAPNNQVLLGLTIFLTMFVMAPVATQINRDALQPMMAEQISQTEAVMRALVPLRAYMFRHTRERDLGLFLRISGGGRPRTTDDVPTTALVPAYMISELKTAFQIGFVLFIPFLVIDMAVASVLLSMGMMQLPPVIVSMPFKLLLFVMVDGWYLIIGSLVKSLV